ncbi:hypothetical protein [Pseudactinotalea sp. Z1748]|uniref:hypothetical protein n=1 Tax=Pseudactinotalea sp. Z1748 TaxID=3413027 RepID=UPI003C7C3120
MSACISRHGEYSSHDPDEDHICRLCEALDEDALITEVRALRALRARLAAVEALADEWQRELDEYRIRDENARYCWATAAREVRAALAAPTDTTKEN